MTIYKKSFYVIVCLLYIFIAIICGIMLANCDLDALPVAVVSLPPVIDPPPPPPELGDMKYITYDGMNIIFNYELESITWNSGQATSAGVGIISVNDILYYLDLKGNIIKSYRLPCVANAIGISGNDIYSAVIEGMQTRIYKNNDEIGLFPWVIEHINVTVTGDVIAETTGHIFYSLSGDETDIIYADNDSLFVFEIDTYARLATFRGLYDYRDGWSTNYFWRNTGWLYNGYYWISSNGYTWNAGGLNEDATAMWTWNMNPYPVQDFYRESPVVIPAASRVEHSEIVTYWIECNTGYLIRYTESIDLLEILIRIYPGDGLRETGYNLQYTLNPSKINDQLYYHHGGFLYCYDFISESVSLISSDVEIWRIQ